jgi:hypothetical protein
MNDTTTVPPETASRYDFAAAEPRWQQAWKDRGGFHHPGGHDRHDTQGNRVKAFAPVSWSGLARPPTTFCADPSKVVGGQAWPGHDTWGKPTSATFTRLPCHDTLAGLTSRHAGHANLLARRAALL